ncbi:hypothetical protein JYU10_00685 [bacterium AH-315-J04]|nr:hypothetical protein [bacterium AH-315-J04]
MMAKTEKTIVTKTITIGKSGTRISAEKYEAYKKVLLNTIPKTKTGIAFADLLKLIAKQIPKAMMPAKGSASWYTTVVKLDLEARKLLQRIEGMSPQRLRKVR